MSPAPTAAYRAAPDVAAAAVRAGHDLTVVEAVLVARHLNRWGIHVTRNRRLRALVDLAHSPAAAEVAALFEGVEVDALDTLVKSFEVLVPAVEAAQHGAVFTPEQIAWFLSEQAIDATNATGSVVDPACGCGALLVAALRRIHTLTDARPGDIVAAQLWGADLSAQSIDRARTLLALTCVTLGDDREHIDDNLTCADSLTVDWDTIGAPGRFDVVLGNPPYVRYQELPDAARTDLAARWTTLSKGNFNLYFAFFELADQLRADGGVVAYITPNNYFTALSAGPLREWMAERRFITDIVDFGHTRVFDAMTYTAITLSDRRRQPADAGYTLCADLATLGSWTTPNAGRITHATLATTKAWRLVGADDRVNIDALETTGVALADCADMRFGVATLRDKLYMIDGDATHGWLRRIHSGAEHHIEVGATVPILKAPDVRDEAAIAANTQRIIYPYDRVAGRAVIWPEEKLRDEYPGCAAYLDAIRGELAQRDRGRKTYPAWYAYGRTQGLMPVGPKLLTALYGARPRFLRDPSPDNLFINGCAVTSTRVPLDDLRIVLNSGLCHYYVETTANCINGGYYAYQKTQLARFGIVEIDDQIRTLDAAGRHGDVDDALAELYRVDLPARYRRTNPSS